MNLIIKAISLCIGVAGISYSTGYFDPLIEEASIFIKANNLRKKLDESAIPCLQLNAMMEYYVPEPVGRYDVEEHYNQLTYHQQKEVNMLMSALYYESSGEVIEGIVGVAYVIYNRVKSNNFPDSFYDVLTHKIYLNGNVSCQFSFYCDGKSDTVPFTLKYNAIKKIAIYTVLGKLDVLGDVPMLDIKKVGNKTFYNNYSVPINRRLTMRVRDSLNYATADLINSKKNQYFNDLIYGKYAQQSYTIKIGNHIFVIAKKNTKLASLL